MKKTFSILAFMISFFAIGQIVKPASFKFSSSVAKPKVGQTVDLIFEGTIDPKWKLYSTENKADPGPFASQLNLIKSTDYQLVGAMKSIKPTSHFDDIWEAKVSYFTGKAKFVQTIKILKANAVVEGKLEFQTCTLKDGSCVMNKEKFKFSF
jgi:hypothetical protein